MQLIVKTNSLKLKTIMQLTSKEKKRFVVGEITTKIVSPKSFSL